MALLFANNAAGTLSTGITAGALALTLNAGQAGTFPAINNTVDTFYATITDAATQTLTEIVSVTAVSGSTFTIARGQDGTTARAWLANDLISLRVTAAELRQLNAVVPSGGIIMWGGAVTAIPNGWNLCDGTNGTPDLRGKFIEGAGGTYAVGSTGGAASYSLTQAQLPAHNHAVTDNGHTHTVSDPQHAHAVSDPKHSHTVTDPGHNHTLNAVTGAGAAAYSAGGNQLGAGSIAPANTGISLVSSATNISLFNAATGISLVSAQTGISTQNTGSGAAIENRPPFYALCFIQKA